MKQHRTRNLRYWWPIALLCGLLVGLLVGLIEPGRGVAGIPDQPGTVTETAFSVQLEPLTRQYLEAIRQRVVEDGGARADVTGETLRSWLIRASMWGPLAGVTATTLELLGDSAKARKGLFFLMPLVRWMSEPFLYPVETSGTEEQRIAEMERVFGFIRNLREQGRSVSLDNVGDAARDETDVLAYRDYYRTMIRLFARNAGVADLSLSLKLSALTLDLPKAVGDGADALAKRREILATLTDLLQAAQEVQPPRRLLLRLDMEEYAYKDMTLELFRTVVEEHPDLVRNADGTLRLGVVIQAYLRDSVRDVRELAAWAGRRDLRVPIRLVKGAYLDHERAVAAEEKRPSPVWDHKPSTDASYEILSACLLLNRDALQPAFATHNIRSMARVMALAQWLAMEPAEMEFQMLYGMGDPLKPVLTDMGYGLREYIPAGSLARGLKYAGRRFQELAGADNALARTMRGDFSVVEDTPEFVGEADQKDGAAFKKYLLESLQKFFGER